MKLAMVPLLPVFALSAVAQESPRQREGRYDEQIRKQATEELQKKDAFHGITVAVEDGIVTLSGKVGLYIDKVNGHVVLSGVVLSKADRQIAYAQARSVPGVFSVKNDLVVAPKAGK